jgi:hypothetical protein
MPKAAYSRKGRIVTESTYEKNSLNRKEGRKEENRHIWFLLRHFVIVTNVAELPQ